MERHWDVISPDPFLNPHEHDYKWLAQIYRSSSPVDETGRLLWHTFGAKTLQLIHKHIHVAQVRDDLETVVVNADVLCAAPS